MEQANREPPSEEMIARFDQTFGFLSAALPDGIIRGGRRITPFNLYEAISVGTALAFAGRQPGADLVRGLLNSEELRELTSGGTNSRRRVTSRIEFVRDSI